MNNKFCIIVASALLVTFSGSAQANATHHRGQAAKNARPNVEALLRKLPNQNIYGLGSTKVESCSNFTCPGYSVTGIGF